LHATEGIVLVDENGVIIDANPSIHRLFGYEPGELKGKKIEALVPHRFAGSHDKNRQAYTDHPHARPMGAGMQLCGLKKTGVEFPVEVSLSPYSENGHQYVIAFVMDITQRKMAEEKEKNYAAELEKQVRNRTMILEEAVRELEQTKRDLRKALAKEKELNELKSRFVSMASHEFRTPLTTMLSSLSLITKYSEQNNRESQLKHVGKIKSSIHNLTEILNDFLSVSRLEEGKFENRPEELNVETFIREIVTEMRTMATKGQELILDYSGDSVFFVDPKLLQNILFNLVSNAIKFSLNDGKIYIRAAVSADALEISVKDAGIGITPQDQRHLFERFFRGHNATNIQGTGLGLNIVAKYVELMQGSINFESEENKGTTFIVKIPAQV
jgi:PAS domain S-box-containing protein